MIRALAYVLVRILFRLKHQGELPKQLPERTLIVSNHQSFFDGILLGLLFPFRPTWIVHTTIARRPPFKYLLPLIDFVEVDAASPMAMKAMVHAIEAGKPVAIFPEGRITVTGRVMKMYDGPAFLAAKTGAWLLPVYIDGACHSFFGRARFPFPKKWRPDVTITVHPLRQLPMPEARTGRERRRLASEQLRRYFEDWTASSQPITSIYDRFMDAVALHGRGASMIEDVRFAPETYGHLVKASLALGRLVGKLSAEGETVGVLMPNAAPSVSLLLGMFATRRIPAMLNYTSGVDGMQSAIETAKIKLVITSRAFLEKGKLTDKVAQLTKVRVVHLEDLRPMFGLGDKVWLMLWALWNPRSIRKPVSPDEPALVLFTSGSEGRPKGVVLSHRNLLSNIAQFSSVIEFSNRDKFFLALPMFHSFGLTAGVLTPLLAGARLFLYPSPLHYRLVPELAYDRDATVIFGTGTFLANYAKFAHPYDFYNIRYVVAGAEKLSAEVRRTYYDKFGLRIIEGYGATECSPVISANSPMFFREGTVGRLMPGMDYRLTTIDGLHQGGVLHVRGPNIMLGYLKHDRPGVIQPPESEFGPGWYDTGDVVEIDERGFIRILERVKRFAKVAGEMVSLEVVEKIAAAAAPQKAHAATIVADGKRGELIVLFSEAAGLRRDALIEAARSLGLPEVAVARRIHHLEKLPRLGSGKFDYLALKALAQQAETA
ncbi:MAG: bifunctional acyl-ACP--phospholipid O-acyltransferase/long-chain-fatty-acid--ACP ligase [Bryobacteraceae bacterium]